MALQRFSLTGMDENGVKESKGNLRLVCRINGGGKLAIWGTSAARQNIDQVIRTGFPCVVECDCIAPESWAAKYGHSYWVPQGNSLQILKAS